MPTIQGTLAYVTLQKPVLDFKKVKKEYKVDVIVDEDTADEWNEKFPKQPAKVIKTTDFEDQFKISPPFPKEKKQYVISLRQSELWPDGKPRTGKDRPKVFLTVGETADGKPALKDVTESTLVANGSIGAVSYSMIETKDWGNIAYLKNIRVDELIEYIPKVVEDDDDDLGVEEEPEFDSEDAPAKPAKTAPSAKVKAEKSSPRPVRGKSEKAETEDDDESPF